MLRLPVFLLVLLVADFSHVYAQASPPESPELFYALKGSTATIPCVSEIAVDPSLEWSVSGSQPSTTGSRMSVQRHSNPTMLMLTISDTQSTDAGLYICSNIHGQSQTELILVEPRSPSDVTTRVTSSHEFLVGWNTPVTGIQGIKGYRIYVTDKSGTPRTITFESAESENTFLLQDLKPGVDYDIKVSAMYADGAGDEDVTIDGPKSASIEIRTPEFDFPPIRIKAVQYLNSTILVTWQPPANVDERSIGGYIVTYKAVKPSKNPPKGEVHIKAKAANGQWQAILRDLPEREKYNIQVAAVSSGQQGIVGKKSPPHIIRHDGFPSEISIKAIPVGPDTVLVTLDTIGVGKMSKLRILYSDDSMTRWNRVKGYDSNEQLAVVTGLQPRSTYYFMAKARVNSKAKQVVTHATTPPSSLESPLELNVVPKTDDSIEATWKYNGRVQPKGYILYLDMRENENGTFRPFKQKAVIGAQAVTEDGLDDSVRYRATVVPFDTNGAGPGSEVFFRIAPSDEIATTANAPRAGVPRFLETPPPHVEMNYGDRLEATCSAAGNPQPNVMWFKGGERIGTPATSRNVLVIQEVKQSFVLTCRADNAYGVEIHRTQVNVTRGIQGTPEIVPLPETMTLMEGQQFVMTCQALGNPPPRTSWYRNGREVQGKLQIEGPNEYIEDKVDRSFQMMCRASNSRGEDEARTHVIVKPAAAAAGSPPVLAKALPRQVTKQMSEDLSLECVFTGQPVPQVTWYEGDKPLMALSAGSSVLFMPSVQQSTNLKCRAVNAHGIQEHIVQLRVSPRERNQDPIAVTLLAHHLSPREVDVTWKVDAGNIDDIRSFQVTVTTDDRSPPYTETLRADQRTLSRQYFTPNVRNTVRLDTSTRRGVVNRAEISFVPQDDYYQKPTASYPSLIADVVEIREDSARIALSVESVHPNDIREYLVRVKDRTHNHTVVDTRLTPPSNSLRLTGLRPNRDYEAMVEMTFNRGQQPLHVNVDFTTANFGGVGSDARSIGDSLTTRVLSPPTTVMTTTMTATTTPMPTRYLPTRYPQTRYPQTRYPQTRYPQTRHPQTRHPQTRHPPTRYPPTRYPPTQPPQQQQDSNYLMSVKVAKKTPYTVDIRWALDRGDLEKVGSFLITIKGSRGQKLLEQVLQGNQRSITMQSLSPGTRYNVMVSALGQGGLADVLSQDEIVAYTPAAGETVDTSNPSLDFEAREVRSSSVRFVWTILNGDPKEVVSYRLRVFERDANGANLLTQNIQARAQSLDLKQLPANKYFYVTLDAIDKTGRAITSSALTFATVSPGQYGNPVTGRRKPNPHDLTQPISPPRRTTIRPTPRRPNRYTSAQPIYQTRRTTILPPPVPRHILNLEIRPNDHKSVRLTWTLITPDTRAIMGYRISVLKDDASRSNLLLQDMAVNTAYFDLSGLSDDRSYIIQLDGLNRQGQPIVSVSTPYQLPPPGRNALPVTASSEDSNHAVTSAPTAARDAELVITGAQTVGRDSVKLTWLTSEGRVPSKRVMIRHAPFYGSQRGQYRIQEAGSSQQEAVITGLNPGTFYGFQVALAPDSSGQFVRWSLMVRSQTDQ